MHKQKPIKRRRLSHEIQDRLLEMIYSGELNEGDQLPSEHELMALYNVGRPSVREALQSLEKMGLISIQHGEKARLKKVTADDVFVQIESITGHLLSSSPENLKHLMEARQVFESGVAFLAAKRCTEESLVKLEQRLDKMRSCMNNREQFLKADQAFHTTIAEMSGNPIFHALSQAMFKWLSGHHIDYQQNLLGVPELEALTIDEHQEIYKQIARKDPDGASRKISEHILRVNKLFDQKN